MSHSARIMQFLIKNLLDRSLMKKNLLKPDFTTQNLGEIVNEIIKMMRFTASNKNITIR